MWVTSSYKNDRFPSCPQLRIRPHFYSPFPQFSSSENLKSWRRTFSARSKRSVSRHPLDRSPRERSSTFRRVPPPPPPPPPIRSIHDRDSDRETLKERPDLPVKIFHPLRHDLCPREHTMWKNKRLDDADVTDGRCRCRDFERTSLRTSSFLCRKIESEGGFESFARSDESSWKRRKKKKMTLFLSLSLSLSRRCLLEPNNAGVHTLLARYKLEVRAHMANTYLCRRRNSRRSKNAKFQQTH